VEIVQPTVLALEIIIRLTARVFEDVDDNE
jgi:hypothetical protein